MNKKIKKLLGALLSVSMAAGSIALPMAASADEATGTIKVDGTTATVRATTSAVALVAKYSGGALTSVTQTPVTANTDVELTVAEGDKVMLWNKLSGTDGITPLADAVTVEALDEPDPFGNDTVLQEWKFNFTSADVEDAIKVDPTRNYITQTANAVYNAETGATETKETSKYGFIGIDEDAYRVSNRYDGFGNQKGQVIPLTQNANGTGVTAGENDKDGNRMDKYYPTRFALKTGDEKYFRVKATVTTLDASKPATASLYTERKHPIYVEETIPAGKSKTAYFSVRTTPIYYEKSNPTGKIADEMVNICVLGENTAFESIEIQEVEPYPVFWVLGDSTVTDGNCSLPFFKQVNYTGVGTGLTMYLPPAFAMVNEGEGGLAANDINHWNMVKDRIKEGDYLYVQYGHNQSSTSQYTTDMAKYYETSHAKNAKLLVVSQIERINTWDGTNNKYNHSAKAYAEASKAFVDTRIAAGATDIAFVDDNLYTLNFYNKITADNNNNKEAIGYYFRCPAQGGYSGTDKTHPNDAGSENLAYQFMQAAKAVSAGSDANQKAVVDGFLTGARKNTPKLVSTDITSGGLGGSGWVTYTPATDEIYPVAIKSIKFDDSGNVTSANVKVQLSQNPMVSYGIVVVTIYDSEGMEKGKIYASDQVDNSTGFGPQTITRFRQADAAHPVTLTEGDTYKAIVYQGYKEDQDMVIDENADGNNSRVAYSAEYDPATALVEEYLLPGELGDTEDFDMYNQTKLNGSGVYIFGGSAANDISLGVEGTGDSAVHYAKLARTGSGSWWIMRKLENLTTVKVVDSSGKTVDQYGTQQTGTYSWEADLKYGSGYGMTFGFGANVSPNKSPFVGSPYPFFTVNTNGAVSANGSNVGTISSSEWTHVKCELNIDAGTMKIKVGGADEVVWDASGYATFGDLSEALATLNYFYVTASANGEVLISNMTAMKLPDRAKSTITVASDEGSVEAGTYGSAYIGTAGTTSKTVDAGKSVTLTAAPTTAGRFLGWYVGETRYSIEPTITVRAYKTAAFTAKFAQQSNPTNVIINYLDGEGNVLKSASTVIVDSDDMELHEEMSFTMDASNKNAIKLTNAENSALTDVYTFRSANTESFASLGATGTNVINLTFGYDGAFNYYEDFTGATQDSVRSTSGAWGSSSNIGHLTVGTDNTHGTYVNFANPSDNKGGTVKFVIPGDTLALTSKYVYEMDIALATGNTDSSTFTIDDAAGNSLLKLTSADKSTRNTTAINWNVNDSNTDILTINQNGAGTPVWGHLKLEVDPSTKAVKATFTQDGRDDQSFSYTVDTTSAIVKGFTNGKGRAYASCYYDNIKVYVPTTD